MTDTLLCVLRASVVHFLLRTCMRSSTGILPVSITGVSPVE